jgi:hypothetical protein
MTRASVAQPRRRPAQLRLRRRLPILEVQLDAAIREEARLKRLTESDAASIQQLTNRRRINTRQLQRPGRGAEGSSIALVRAQLAEANYQVELHIIRAPR